MSELGIANGVEIGGYRVEELIGRGGMGEVYRAHDDRLDRNVALKILASRYVDDDTFRERLLRESRLAASLDHPNVVPVYDAGEADAGFYLAMRYVEGPDLRAVLRREGALPVVRALEIVSQLAGALDAAHAKGLVHRDVKPSNVLIDERGHCYLADFGLTQSVSDRGQATDGSLLGTLDYVAPEQIRGDEVDGRADVYALGCLLFECLTGEVPFGHPSEVATLYAHLEDDPPSASARRSAVPQEVDVVLAQAMAKEPEERFSSCADLVDEARVALGLATAGPHRLRLPVAATAILVLVATAALAAILLMPDTAPAATAGSVIRIDPESGDVTARYRVSAHPGAITTGAGRVWAADYRDGALWTLEPRTGELRRIASVGEPRDLSTLGGKVYVVSDSPEVFANVFTGTIARYDAVTGVRERKLDLYSCTVAAGEGVVWSMGLFGDNRLSTGPGKLHIVRSVWVRTRTPVSVETTRINQRDLAVGYGSVWVLGDGIDRRLWRLDRSSGRVLATVELPFIPRTVAAGEGGVWISAPLDDRVLRIDPETNAITATIRTGHGASGVAAGAGSVWVTSTIDGTVSRVDPRTAEITDEIDVGGRPREVAVGAGGVWLTADAR
jgi:DNA-binding beta-propeller fold protein YncE/tRNA A-37 threonylcarbamoyl transferase component Bud32